MIAHAPGIEIGRPSDTYRRIRIQSNFGKLTVLVTDGHLPYPYGREMTGYEVANLADTLAKAKAAGVAILVAPYTADQRMRPSCNSPAAISPRSTRPRANRGGSSAKSPHRGKIRWVVSKRRVRCASPNPNRKFRNRFAAEDR